MQKNFNLKKIIHYIEISDLKVPEIYSSSDSFNSVNVGESIQLNCYVRGIPTPAITWFKVSNN